MAENLKDLHWNLVAAKLGMVRIKGPGGVAYLPPNLADADAANWEAAAIAHNETVASCEIPPKPERVGDVQPGGGGIGFILNRV